MDEKRRQTRGRRTREAEDSEKLGERSEEEGGAGSGV